MEFRTEIEQARGRIRPATAEECQEAQAAIAALSRPRRTGSSGAAEAEAELRRRLEALDYEIHPLGFSFSTWPGRFGVPLAGLAYLLATGLAVQALIDGAAGTALGVLLLALIAFVLGARLAASAITAFPFGRIETANWLVQRPGARPRYVIVAHRDTKSQPISTFLRTAAVALALFAWLALAVLALLARLDPAWHWTALTIATAGLAAAAGVLLVACRVENESPGALDNATGLAALLAIARREREQRDVAFLITDGEELGLAGARAAAPRLPPVHGIINLDGLDDDGPVRVIERFGWPRHGFAPHLATALLAAASTLELPAARQDLPIGVLVDHMPFVAAGHPALTIMRGTFRSLRRVHRPEDTPDRTSGRGAADAAALVSGALDILRRAA
ncbi:MAG TPA: M28 family peptidase [Longimicrobiales bacterium]